MTCIVGIEHQNKVYIGGDSAISDEYCVDSCYDNEKVFTIPPYIFGICGSMRVTQIIHYAFNALGDENNDNADIAFLVTKFTSKLRKLLQSNGISLTSDNGDILPDTSFLLGFKNKLYTVDNDFQIVRNDCGYASVGTGSEVAIGALYATKDLNLDPYKRLQIALEASSTHTLHVRSKFHYLSI